MSTQGTIDTARVDVAVVIAALGGFVLSALIGAQVLGASALYMLNVPMIVAGLVIAASMRFLPLRANQLGPVFLGPVFLGITIGIFVGLYMALLDQHALFTRWVDWGSFQTGDADDFLGTAFAYLVDGNFATPRGRVISNLLYAGLLDLGNMDVRIATWPLAAALAVAIALFATDCWRSFGPVAGAIAAYMAIDYGQDHLGGISTEIPGFLLGLLGTQLILRATRFGNWQGFLIGIAILTLALLTRMGALFILPTLLMWSIWGLGISRPRSFMIPTAGIVLIIGLFAANSSITREVVPDSAGGFVNAADSWYATVVEGQLALGERSEEDVIPVTRWRQIYLDNPGLEELPSAEMSARKADIIVSAVLDHPLAAVVGSVREIGIYLFKFKILRSIEIKPLRFLCYFLIMTGLVASIIAWRRGDRGTAAMLTVSFGAILASQPFLYGGESRVPAPTFGFLIALAAAGTGPLVSRLQNLLRLPNMAQSMSVSKTGAMRDAIAFTLAMLVIGTAFYGYQSGRSWLSRGADLDCPERLRFAANLDSFRAIGPGTPLDRNGAASRKALIQEMDASSSRLVAFSFNAPDHRFEPMERMLESLTRPVRVGYGLRLAPGGERTIVYAPIDDRAGLIQGCATVTDIGIELR